MSEQNITVCPFCGRPDCKLTKEQVLQRGPVIEVNACSVMRKATGEHPRTYAFKGVRAYYSLSALIPDKDDENPHAYTRFVYDEDVDCADGWEECELQKPLEMPTETEMLEKLGITEN